MLEEGGQMAQQMFDCKHSCKFLGALSYGVNEKDFCEHAWSKQMFRPPAKRSNILQNVWKQ